MARIAVNGVTLNVTEIAPRARRLSAVPSTPIIMVHGLAASSAFWYAAGAPFMALLGRCILYDLRGHGKSEVPDSGYSVAHMADDLAALMDEMGIGKAHIVAHSFGGMIALLTALKTPERIASLVLADVRIRPVQAKISIPSKVVPPALIRRLNEIGVDLGAVSKADDGIDYLRTVARIQIAAGDEAGDLLTALYQHPRLFRSRRNAERWIHLTERASLIADLKGERAFTAADLSRIEAPILVMAGQNSTTLPSARSLAQRCPHAILHEVPNVGHFFPMTHPKLFLRPSLRFVRAVNRGDPRLARRMQASRR